MTINNGSARPAIHVYYSPLLNDSSFRPLLYGMEEEGIPSVLKKKEGNNSLELGHQAATDSILGVGIGVGADNQIVLHYAKLPKDQPLFQIKQNEKNKQRILGSNAARLVKGIPFKTFQETGEDEANSTISAEEIARIVKKVLQRLEEIT